ncbi:t-SNARE [Phakopsora pachyrhizi]|uniref:t-SNARE n=1 Tax=Phakopsora pachyrhizi TaxID=170000 RepID=A0AAV0BR39_PHAPC|nr:t-SNARE [Phakopsora pachyrhizi]
MARDRLAAMRANQKTFQDPQNQPHSGPTLSVQPQGNSQLEAGPLTTTDEKSLDIDNFMEQVSDLNSLIKTINDNISQLRNLQQQSLTELDSDSSPSTAQNDQILSTSTTQRMTEASRETSSMIRNCKNRIESIQSMIQASSRPRNQFNVHLTQIGALKKRLMDSISKYQSVEQEFRQKSQARIERQYRIVNPNATQEEIRQVIGSDQSAQIFSQALMTSNRYGDARAAFNEVKERHQQLKRIETTLTELMEMFNDLATMVEEQDQVIKDVENGAVEVEKDMEQAGQHITKARDSAAAARKKRWICFFIILLLLAIAGAIVAIVIVTNNNKRQQ